MVKFSRKAVESMLAEGDAVTVTVSGTAGDVGFSGTDVIRVIRRGKDAGKKKKPALFQAAEYAGSAPAGPTGAMKIFYAHLDHLGTPRAMTDASGNVVWKADYRPFGEAEVVIGDVGNEIRFPGQYFDAESGLHYNWHRYYDPGIGRYLRADPIGLAGGANLYTYVPNNPLNFIDPLGLYPGQMPPSPPSYNPDTWVKKINPNGKWEVYDPDTGKRWVAHPEDEKHWRHWDDPDKKGPDKRWPRNSKKKWHGQKRKAYGEQSECDPSGDEPEWEPPLDEFHKLDPFGRVVPFDQPIFIYPIPHTHMPPLFVPKGMPVPVY